MVVSYPSFKQLYQAERKRRKHHAWWTHYGTDKFEYFSHGLSKIAAHINSDYFIFWVN